MSKAQCKIGDIHAMEIAAGKYFSEKYTYAYETLFYEKTRQMVADIAASGNTGQIKILELGCGPGNLTKFLFQKPNCRITAVDISPDMVLQAQKKLHGVEFHVAPLERLPFGDNSFDVVAGDSVLHHLLDLRESFDEICRVLKPGGRFVFGEPVESSLGTNKNLRRALIVPFLPLYLLCRKKNKRERAVLTDVNFDAFSTPVHGHIPEERIMGLVSNPSNYRMSIAIKRLGIISSWLGSSLFQSKGFDRIVFKLIWHLDLIMGRFLRNCTSEMIISGDIKKGA